MKTAAERLARATLEGEAHNAGVLNGRAQVVVERRLPTAATMAAAARRLGADLVVMAPHDRGALSRALGFSLTEATVDRLEGAVPVLCARGRAAALPPHHRRHRLVGRIQALLPSGGPARASCSARR